jgi:hypothetical protein
MQDEESIDLERFSPSLSAAIAPGEIIIGVVESINHDGHPVIDYPENPCAEPISAVSTLSITPQHIGRQVALLFAQGDPRRPVIMGLIHSPLNALIENFELSTQEASQQDAEPLQTTKDEVTVDGQRVVFEAKEEIVLKCGEASITLTKAGKILIRGKYLLSRSSGVNRIQGGSVQVN